MTMQDVFGGQPLAANALRIEAALQGTAQAV
jgi:hypothetical protein